MLSQLLAQIEDIQVTPELLALAGVGFGILVVVYGLAGSFSGLSPAGRRMAAAASAGPRRSDFDLIRAGQDNPSGLLKAFVPTSKHERTKIARKLRQAGIHRPTAVRNFYLVRSVLGLIMPCLLIVVILLPDDVASLTGMTKWRNGLDWITMFQILTVLILLGFYGPSYWLKSRIKARRTAIQLGLPNALDLLQVSVEAGLGFDASMARVAHELARVCPEISEEFMILQLEIQAGKERDRAYNDMADRTGLDEVTSFVNVILQSTQFGTSVSQALNAYAEDMRLNRELRAQEKANRLPVQMSAVLAALMMPTLLMICLAPVLIRWIGTM